MSIFRIARINSDHVVRRARCVRRHLLANEWHRHQTREQRRLLAELVVHPAEVHALVLFERHRRALRLDLAFNRVKNIRRRPLVRRNVSRPPQPPPTIIFINMQIHSRRNAWIEAPTRPAAMEATTASRARSSPTVAADTISDISTPTDAPWAEYPASTMSMATADMPTRKMLSTAATTAHVTMNPRITKVRRRPPFASLHHAPRSFSEYGREDHRLRSESRRRTLLGRRESVRRPRSWSVRHDRSCSAANRRQTVA